MFAMVPSNRQTPPSPHDILPATLFSRCGGLVACHEVAPDRVKFQKKKGYFTCDEDRSEASSNKVLANAMLSLPRTRLTPHDVD